MSLILAGLEWEGNGENYIKWSSCATYNTHGGAEKLNQETGLNVSREGSKLSMRWYINIDFNSRAASVV
jgi:hypothetical protein